MQFSVTGVSNTGNSAPIPADSSWQVSDTAIASIDATTGLFTAQDYGTVTVQYVVNGEVKGEKEIGVVKPDNVTFSEENITAIFDKPKEILVNLWYNGKPVAFDPANDVILGAIDMRVPEDKDKDGVPDVELLPLGVFDGVYFIGNSAAGVRSVLIGAEIAVADDYLFALANVTLYYEDEATFDFDNADMGNRSLAWNRTIENARTLDNDVYYVTNRDKPIVIDYTFALDMSSIDIPPRFEDLKGSLPGGDNPNATAWTFLLYLAERVCIQTHVKIRAEFSKDVTVDVSQLKVVTDYFTLSDATVDENNVLTVTCNWINQTQPIDSATANPLCILTGISLTVNQNADFFNNRLLITNNGIVSYDIYLAATTLYTFPNQPGNEKYGLIPYMHEPPCRDAVDDKGNKVNKDLGAHFASQYLDFADTFMINTESREGWIEELGKTYYYVNNVPVTGMQLLPDPDDNTKRCFYEFDATGVLMSTQPINGLRYFTVDGTTNLYYATNGVVQTGWQTPDGQNYYYFDPNTGAAYNGVRTIKEKMNPAVAEGKYTPMVEYTYTFEDYKLVLGCWVDDTNIWGNDGKQHTGRRYRWAGDWKDGWFEVEGKEYFATKNYPNMISTGYVRIMKQDATSSADTQYHLLDDLGAFQKQYTGVYYDGANYAYLKNGVRQVVGGVYEGNGYYYYVNGGNGLLYVDQTAFPVNANKTNGLIPGGYYDIDSFGRLQIKLIEESAIDTPEHENVSVSTSVLGRAVNVNASATCKVGYLDTASGKYVPVEANKNTHGDGGYDFVVPKNATVAIVIAGDINGDGVVDTTDYVAMAQMVRMPEISIVSDEEAMEQAKAELAKAELASDLNSNGKVNAADLIRLARSLRNDTSLDW